MKNKNASVLVAGLCGLLGFVAPWVARHAHAAPPTAGSALLPEIDKDEDEFYARVDEVLSPTELRLTVLDVWQPMDKVREPRWPHGIAKVKPAKRTVVLEDLTAAGDAEQRRAAMDFLRKSLKESDHEVICTGSSVSVQNRAGGAVISVTGYVYVKQGFTLNNALVSRGLATTSNPFYKSWQEKAKQQKLGIWQDRQ
jgi:hypothetical protein